MQRMSRQCIFPVIAAASMLASCAPAPDRTDREAAQTIETAFVPQADDFGCIRDMHPVRGFFVDNLLGDLEGTLSVANSPTGGVYPPGSVVQLVPAEVMVKRQAGFDPQTGDWEFFELDVSQGVTQIRVRGAGEVVNQFGGNCLSCHEKAEAQWDLICEQDHGCDPIPLTPVMIRAIQNTDPRCPPLDNLPSDQMEALEFLRAVEQARQEAL